MLIILYYINDIDVNYILMTKWNLFDSFISTDYKNYFISEINSVYKYEYTNSNYFNRVISIMVWYNYVFLFSENNSKLSVGNFVSLTQSVVWQ